MHDPRAVANHFIKWSMRSKDSNEPFMPITALALQKLIYISNAIVLTETGQSLVTESPIVGQHDPIFPSLHASTVRFGIKPIIELLDQIVENSVGELSPSVFYDGPFTIAENMAMVKVCEFYHSINCDASRLVVFTGGHDEAWEEAQDQAGGIGQTIKDHDIVTAFEMAIAPFLPIIPSIRENVSGRHTG